MALGGDVGAPPLQAVRAVAAAPAIAATPKAIEWCVFISAAYRRRRLKSVSDGRRSADRNTGAFADVADPSAEDADVSKCAR